MDDSDSWLPVKAACREAGRADAFSRVHAAIRAGRIDATTGDDGQRLVRLDDVRALLGARAPVRAPGPAPAAPPARTAPHPSVVALQDEIERRRLLLALAEMDEREAERDAARERLRLAATAREREGAEATARERDAQAWARIVQGYCDAAFAEVVRRVGLEAARSNRSELDALVRAACLGGPGADRKERLDAIRAAIASVCAPAHAEQRQAQQRALLTFMALVRGG